MKILPLSVSALLFFSTCLPNGMAAEKPNIIIINIDDLGYADIGPFGSENETPNLDRMAKEGRKLNSHYAAPVCSPSRAALMTGCYPKRVLSIPHVLFPVSSVGLNPQEITIADLLKGQGYATACIGKWHLGDQPEFLPTRQGFDYYYGIPYSNDMGTIEDGAKNNPGTPLPKPKPAQVKNNKNKANSADEETGVRGPQQPPLALLKNETVIARVKTAEQFSLTQNYTTEAKKFIADNKDKSFFLYLPHSAVHFPLYPSRKYMGKSSMGLLGDWVREVDWSVGQILDQLRELNLTEKTLVVFTSDNGGSFRHGSVNAPLRGNKTETWEGGIRVCTIAWWPGKIPADTETDAITSMMDLLPTCAHLAGAALPPDHKIDGQNQWPVLSGNPASPPRDHFFYYRGHRMEAVRSGPWKLHLDKKKLFNLENDIGESSDQYAAHADIVARLEKLALTMEDDLGLDGVGPGCRPLGRVSNPQPIISMDGTVREDLAGEQKVFP